MLRQANRTPDLLQTDRERSGNIAGTNDAREIAVLPFFGDISARPKQEGGFRRSGSIYILVQYSSFFSIHE